MADFLGVLAAALRYRFDTIILGADALSLPAPGMFVFFSDDWDFVGYAWYCLIEDRAVKEQRGAYDWYVSLVLVFCFCRGRDGFCGEWMFFDLVMISASIDRFIASTLGLLVSTLPVLTDHPPHMGKAQGESYCFVYFKFNS